MMILKQTHGTLKPQHAEKPEIRMSVHPYVSWFKYLKQKPGVLFRASNPPNLPSFFSKSPLKENMYMIYLPKENKATLKHRWQTFGTFHPQIPLKPEGKYCDPNREKQKKQRLSMLRNLLSPESPLKTSLALSVIQVFKVWRICSQLRSLGLSNGIYSFPPSWMIPRTPWDFIWFQVEKVWGMKSIMKHSEGFKRCFWRVSCWRPWLFQRIEHTNSTRKT